MQAFLATIAQDLTQRFRDLSRVCVIVPNRRAGLFLLQYLEQALEKEKRTSWMPEVLPIEQLFYRLAGAEPADNLTLLFQLYRAYTRVHPEPEPFDAFYYWGELMLKDFRDIDQFLVDPELLYTELREEKEALSDFSFLEAEQIELIRQFWTHFRAQAQNENQGFLQYWQYLAPLYRHLRSSWPPHTCTMALRCTGRWLPVWRSCRSRRSNWFSWVLMPSRRQKNG
ncbi:hypothetical protein [Nitritalea halalkaliphila]|uniref:hypothetical protein n=1 Tax=Nitritalea halalkaliphila TaxID=590849 RepID=UPI001EE68168|nr:hypothetical protein [Nitritalea halalkaliphila]